MDLQTNSMDPSTLLSMIKSAALYSDMDGDIVTDNTGMSLLLLHSMVYCLGDKTPSKRVPQLMYTACRCGNLELVKLLHDHGADLDERGGHGGFSGIIIAAEFNYMDIVLYLIEHGADYTMASFNGTTALKAAQGENLQDLIAAMTKAIRIRETKRKFDVMIR